MGYVPPPGPPAYRGETTAMTIARLEREFERRWSILPWRRGAAHRACLELISIREALLGA